MAKKSKKGRSSLFYPSMFLAFFVLALDMLSKYHVHTRFPLMTHDMQWYPYGGIGLFEDFAGIEFSVVHAINYGAAWGMLSGFQLYLLVFRIAFTLGLGAYLFVFNKRRDYQIPLLLIFVGAAGNIADYFIYGHVVDMFYFVLWGYSYPVFNVADCAIFLGVSSILLKSLKE